MRIKSISSIILVSIILTGMISCSSCQSNKQGKKTIAEFKAPTPSTMLTSQEDRLNYMVNNYWGKFDFADTTQISRADFIESHFYNYLNNYLYVAELELSKKALKNLITTSHLKDSLMFAHFIKMSEKYFYDPNSPFRNEEFYVVVMDYVVNAPNISEINKVRPKYQLEMALKNRVGDIATNFGYTLSNGKKGKLHDIKSDYTLIFFNDPDCPDCLRVKDYISNNETLKRLISGGNNQDMKVLAMYTDENVELWNTGIYPKDWINGYDEGRVITNTNLYAIPATPSQYLLDKDKRVIFKDAPIEQISEWLNHNAQQ